MKKQTIVSKDGTEKEFIFFNVEFNNYRVVGNSTANEVLDRYEATNCECALYLPDTYTEDGDPTPLIMAFHGAGGRVSAELGKIGGLKHAKSCMDAGYAVLDVDGNVPTGLSQGCPEHIFAAFKAYRYAIKHFNLCDKVLITGGSMGGLSALVYCAYAKITPCACVTNCPVCDLVYHYTERPDLPRTLYSAFGDYEGTMEDALKSCSPLHLAEKLPHIPYTVFHCEADKSVNLEKHSLRFVEAMEAAQQRIVLRKIPFRGHCDLSAEGRVAYMQAILSSI